jgi:hypothetical protein
MNDTAVNKPTILLWLTAALTTCQIARADFVFDRPQNLGPVINSPSSDFGACTSADGLELYFASDRAGGFGTADIWLSTRPSVDVSWGPPTNLGATVNSPYMEAYPSLSSDGLTLYFSDLYSGTPRPGGLGGADIWVATRTSHNDAWTTPVNLGAPVNSSAMDLSPTVSGDGLILVFASSRAGTSGPYDLWMSTRATVQDPWGSPVNLGAYVNSSAGELECSLSADGLTLFFASGRPGGLSNYDLWMTTRKSRGDPWTPTTNVGSVVNSTSTEGSAGVSTDMRTLYFDSDRPGGLGGYDLWEAPIIPVVDFDGDEMVAMGDLVRLIESWGKDDPLVDIGPNPWGDGVVDEKDLEVLMSDWDQEIPSPNLIARWRLDETSGVIAADTVGGNDGTVFGDPLWQPSGGEIGGALLLDGVDDYIGTEYVLNPAAGPFSVFAWVQGGGPGQVIVSQEQGANWLGTDGTTEALRTDLRQPATGGRSAKPAGPPLISSAVITDGTWHRVGFVWDGSQRILYVDDVEVARDTATGLETTTGGLHLGVDGTLTPGTFWSGLMDDIRIYNKAVKPIDK